MVRNLFTREFYKEVFDQMDKYLSDADNFLPEREQETATAYVCIEGDDRFLEHPDDDDVIEMDIECDCVCEWEDDSFDHAFGTWHDPYACWQYAGIESLGEVTVYVNGKKVEGFDEDAFWSQFYEYEHGKFKAGDEVQYLFRKNYYNVWSEKTGTLLYYDTYHCEWAIKTDDGIRTASSVRHAKREEAEA